MDRKTFWFTKSSLPQFQAVGFEHPAWAQPFRLVADQFVASTLGGQVHKPAPMTVTPPDQTGDAAVKLTRAFLRNVVGRGFKRKLTRVRAAGTREPIPRWYRLYLDDLSTPAVAINSYFGNRNVGF